MEPTIEIANHAPPAVVRIHRRRLDGENDFGIDQELFATGILVSPDRVVTAWHVVKDYQRASPCIWSVRHEASGEERVIVDSVLHDNDQMDLAIAVLDAALPFEPLLWLSGSPEGDRFPSQAHFSVYGYPVEDGGETLCEIVLPAEALAFGRKVQSRKVYRLELARTPTPGFSGGPCMLRLGEREARVGLTVHALLAGETTSVMRGADEILEFLMGRGIANGSMPTAEFVARHGSSPPSPDAPAPPRAAGIEEPDRCKEHFTDKSRPTIAIVGVGFSGTVSAIRILELATEPLNLLMIHADEPSKHGGLAYSAATCGWEYLLNIQAGRISLYRERPTDFLDWVNSRSESERATWTEHWKRHRFLASSAVPRRIYGHYLASRFTEARQNAIHIVDVAGVTATVDDIRERTDKVEIDYRLSGATLTTAICDRVIVATGHDQSLVPEVLRNLLPNSQVFETPYSEGFFKCVARLTARQSVLIVGTGLSSYDAVLAVNKSDFKGDVFMVSRHGFTHKAYPGDHVHDILPLPLPPLPAAQLSAGEMLEKLEEVIEHGRESFQARQPGIADDVIEERVLKALEPWTAQWIQRSDATQVRNFLETAKSRLTTSRTGIVPEVNDVIWGLRHDDRRLHLIAGDIQSAAHSAAGFVVKIKKTQEEGDLTLEPTVIVCCLGANANYNVTTNALWCRLRERGTAQAHLKTGRGICVDEFGALVRVDGSVSERVIAVGPMRQGDEIERRGRLGAFVFSIGTIRNQALLAAVRMLWLSQNAQHAQIDRYSRQEIDSACEVALADPRNVGKAKRLINAILAVRLSDVTKYLKPGDHVTVSGLDKWLQKHLEETIKEINAASDADIGVIRHVLWWRAHSQAAISATDIKRLSDDHPRVRKYGDATLTKFLDERLACSSLLRASVSVFGAATGSMLIYSPEDRKLHPFAMYRRVESFTPTAYGEGVAGALVKAFFEREKADNMAGVTLCRVRDRVVGAFVPDYNMLQTDLKKGAYIGHDRRFPSVLVALLVLESQLLGVVYIESERHNRFDCEDATLLTAMLSSKLEMLREAQRKWDRRSTPIYRFGDFEGADLHRVKLNKQDLSQALFVRAGMVEAELDNARLDSAVFDYADLRGSHMRGATIIGASFLHVNLTSCIFDGAEIRFCTFAGSNLKSCHFAGASIANCTFRDANLSGITFREINVSTLDFSNAVMRDCVLRKLTGVNSAVWSGVDLSGSRVDISVWEALPEVVKSIHAGNVRVEK